MAVPRLATPRPFYLLDPVALTTPFETAATSGGASDAARTLGVDEMRPVDLVVCGSVAVNRRGVRVGKGAGYSDIEVALLTGAPRSATVRAGPTGGLVMVRSSVKDGVGSGKAS